MKIGPPILEKIFEGFFFIIDRQGGYLGHVTNIVLINFHFLLHKRLHAKFGKKWLKVVSEKSKF